MERECYSIEENLFRIEREYLAKWMRIVLVALKENGKKSAGMDPQEMVEVLEDGSLRVFVLGSDPMIEMFIPEGDWRRIASC